MARRPARKALLSHHGRVRRHVLSLYWALWSGRPHAAESLRRQLAELHALRAMASRHLDVTAQPLRMALQADKDAHRLRTCKAIHEAALANDASTVHRLVRQLGGRRQCRPLPAVAMQDGSLARSPAEAAERWRQHAQELHDGHAVVFSELLASADSTQNAFVRVPRSILVVPTLTELAGVFAATAPRRAHGSDCIPPAIVKRFADVLAPIFHPVVVKSVLRIAEPIQWRGGVLAHFPKGKGDPMQCGNNREIVLADVTAKAFHKCRRSRLKPFLEASARSTQMGGVSRRSTDFGSHLVRTALDFNRSVGKSTATIFIDVVAAFYNLVRAHVLPMPDSDPQVSLSAVLAEQCVDPHLAASAAAAAMHTWFAIQASPTLTEYSKGALPGDPEADLLFTVLATRVLNEIHEAFVAEGLTPDFPKSAARPLFSTACQPVNQWPPDVSYVDDAAFTIQAPAGDLIARTTRALQIVHAVFTKYSLPLNFGPGKTEILFDLCGRGSKAIKRELCFEHGYKINVELGGRMVPIFACRAYKHLGGQIAVGGAMTAEIKQRTADTNRALAELRRPLFYCSASHQDDRNAVIAPYLWSRLFYNAGTWPTLLQPQRKQLNGTYMRVVNAAAAVTFSEGVPSLSPCEALQTTGQPTADAALRGKRLCYLPRLLMHAPAPLLVLLDCAPSWKKNVLDDFEWLWAGSSKVAELPPPSEQPHAWISFIREHPKAWRRIVQDMLRPPSAAGNGPVEFFPVPAPPSSAEPALNPRADTPSPAEPWPCYICGASFPSRRGLASHATRAHGRMSDASNCMFHTACIACLCEFHTRPRLSGHLRYGSSACLEAIARSVPPPSAQEIGELLADERSRTAQARSFPGRHLPCHRPMCRLAGPLPEWAPASH